MNGHAPHFEVEDFADPAAALARVHEIYALAVDHLRRGLQHYVDGTDIGRHVRACYPLLRVRTDTVARWKKQTLTLPNDIPAVFSWLAA